MGGLESHPAPIGLNAKSTTNYLSGSAMRHAKFHGNTRRDSTTRMLSIEWQVNNGYQEFHKFLIKIKKTKTPETAIYSIFNLWSKDNFHSNITYCKIKYTQIHIWMHTNQKSIHPIYMLSWGRGVWWLPLAGLQWLQFICCHFNYWLHNNWAFIIEKNRKTTQNNYFLHHQRPVFTCFHLNIT